MIFSSIVISAGFKTCKEVLEVQALKSIADKGMQSARGKKIFFMRGLL
jgi:hypothetical protein